MEPSLQKVADFFRTAQWPKEIEHRPTFFSIAGFPHYENVMSNVYQFFFGTDNPHGMGTLCVDALLDVIRTKIPELNWAENSFRRVFARRELRTDQEKRLDILLHNGTSKEDWQSARASILIENKVNHWLANDLNHYRVFVDQENRTGHKVGIVMGLKAEPLPMGWFYVTHLEWAQAVEIRLGKILYRAEPRYVTLLLELIENIRNMSNVNEGFGELMMFVQQNQTSLQRAEKIRAELFYQIPDAVASALPSLGIWSPKEGKNDGWLTATPAGNPPLKYELSYSGIVYPDQGSPTYSITISTTDNADSAPWRTLFSKYIEAQGRGIKLREDGRNYVVTKEYSFTASDYHRFPQLIAANLQDDWQPLEKYWLNTSTQIL